MDRKLTRKVLSLKEKMSILKEFDKFVGTKVDFANSINMPVSSLKTIISKRKEIEDNASQAGSRAGKTKKMKTSTYADLEESLSAWFLQARASNIPINGTLLKEKAIDTAHLLGINDFSASNGWLDRFKKRHDLVYNKMSGEAKSVNESTVDTWMANLKQKIKNYKPDCIYNVDETGLFFNLLPGRTLIKKGERCHGGKQSKERLTIILCVNAAGEKIPPLVIGKYKKPRCFKNVKKFPTAYDANKKAWVTAEIFKKYLQKLDKQMAVKNKKIMLFMDQCAAHPPEVALQNIEIVFFPANTTSMLQPLDLGIIHSFKALYRKMFVKKALSLIENNEVCVRANVLDAMSYTVAAWHDVKEQTVRNCFKKAGFSFDEGGSSTILEPEEIVEMEEQEWQQISGSLVTFDEFLKIDDDLVTTEIQSVEEIVQNKVKDSSDEENDDVEEKSPITYKEAITKFEEVKRYLLSIEGNEQLYLKINDFEKILWETNIKRTMAQKTINDYFK